MTHAELLSLCKPNDRPGSCRASLRRLPAYWQPTGNRSLVRVLVYVCDECDRALEVSIWPTGWDLRLNYPYRPNIRKGRRRSK